MDVRQAEIFLPGGAAEVRALLGDVELVAVLPSSDENAVRVLVASDKTEALLDLLERRLGSRPDFRVTLLRVQATIPRPAEPEEKWGPTTPAAEPARAPPRRISRAELLAVLEPGTRVTALYLVTVVLSTIVAAVGLMNDSVAVVIGAMVIAPLLAPNMAAALATTLGDFALLRRALGTNLWGVATALALAVALGVVGRVDPAGHEIAVRTQPTLADIALALAAGTAGALGFTSGVAAALVGVMVAVALLPPLVVAGLLLGDGHVAPAARAALLLATNVICVNLAAVATFLVQGVRPRTWWKADRARRAARRALVLWSVLLVVLAALIYVAQG